jgi:hypothetical protein
MAKTFKWTVEIEVDETWVADGFDLQDGRDVNTTLRSGFLQYADDSEVKIKVLSGPNRADVAEAQGYRSVAAMNKENKRNG